jgi:hypothetical protein
MQQDTRFSSADLQQADMLSSLVILLRRYYRRIESTNLLVRGFHHSFMKHAAGRPPAKSQSHSSLGSFLGKVYGAV